MTAYVRRVSRAGRSGAEITSGFVESGQDLMAVTTTVPRKPLAGMVLCPSLFTEALRNYHREALLAEALAARGFAVQRPQYRGTANSDDVAMERDTIMTDARTALAALRHDTGVDAVAFGGIRFGGLVAASVAADVPGAPLVLIEPATSARGFFDEGLRAKVISLFRAKTRKASKESLVEELEREGWIELLGHQLEHSLYASSADWDLREILGHEPRPILLVQLGAEGEVRKEYEELASAWSDDGFDVEIARGGEARTWWFLHEQIEEGRKIRHKDLAETDDVVTRVCDFLSSAAATRTG